MKILVLGATGMLGHTVYRFFKHCYDCTVIGSSRRGNPELVHFDVNEGFDKFAVDLSTVDYVINCIGVTKPYCHDDNSAEIRNATSINSVFPHQLAARAEEHGFRVINIATDCVFSGIRGQYAENDVHDAVDAYGKTKSLGEVRSPRVLNIRCSIIGTEQEHKAFLLSWFLQQPIGSRVNGFAHHRWNGVTTLQFARLCKEIIFRNRFDELVSESHVHHFSPNPSVTKYELLGVFNEIFERSLVIERRDGTEGIDRTLRSNFKSLEGLFSKSSIESALRELRQFDRMGDFVHHTLCRFCASPKLTRILDFGDMPLAGGFLRKEQFASEKFYPLKVHFCEDCTLVQVNNVIPQDTLFKNYFYFSSSIRTLVEHCGAFAKEVTERFLRDRANPCVFEIGCNDGVMLKPFAALGVRAVGMDPASNVVASVKDQSFTIVNDFFNEKTALEVRKYHGQFDAVTSSYSFAHIDDMRSVMAGVKHLLKEDGVFVFEVYYLGTLLDEMQYDMIYHEHCSYYSLRALSSFLARYGMEVFETKFTPGVRSGAVRFYARNIGKRTEPISQTVSEMANYENERGFARVETYLDYASRVANTRTQLMELLERLKAAGKTIMGYGASGRGTMIMSYCGIGGRHLDFVVDDAPAKHGFFTPGNHVEIRQWDHAADNADFALLFAWSFMDEVVRKRKSYIERGGKFIVPLPEVRIVGAESLAVPAAS